MRLQCSRGAGWIKRLINTSANADVTLHFYHEALHAVVTELGDALSRDAKSVREVALKLMYNYIKNEFWGIIAGSHAPSRGMQKPSQR